MLFEDRTRAHADHIGQGFERQTTAAVGVLKAVHCGEWYILTTATLMKAFLSLYVFSWEVSVILLTVGEKVSFFPVFEYCDCITALKKIFNC